MRCSVHGSLIASLLREASDDDVREGLLFGTCAETSARASGYCEVMVLSWESFSEALVLSGMGVGLAEGLIWGNGVLEMRSAPACKASSSPHYPANSVQTTDGGGPSVLVPPRTDEQRASQQQTLFLVKYVETGAETLHGNGGFSKQLLPASPSLPLQTQQLQEQQGSSSRQYGGSVKLNTIIHSRLQSMAVEELRIEIERSGRSATWVDFHKGALQATTDAHREFLMKLVKAQTSIDRANEKKGRQKRMFEMMLQESKPMARSQQWEDHLVVSPDSTMRLMWETVALVGMLFYAFGTPLRLMFAQGACLFDQAALGHGAEAASSEAYAICLSQWGPSMVIDYLFDLFFIVDLLLRSRYFAFREFDEERDCEVTIDAPAAIWEMSRRQRYFYCSAVLLVPWDLLALSTGYLRLYRLVKLCYVFLTRKIWTR